MESYELVELSGGQVMLWREPLDALFRAALRDSVTAHSLNLDREIDSTLSFGEWATGAVTVVAAQGANLVGAIFGRRHDDAKAVFVYWLAVHPAARRQNLGNRLADALQRVTDCDAIKGSVLLDDPVAMAFWKQRGWQRLQPPPRQVMMGRSV